MNPEDAFFVYVLQLSNGHLDIGQTNNLERRQQEHQNGRSPYIKKFIVEKNIYTESFPSRSEAMKRDKFLKSCKGREFLHTLNAEQSASGGRVQGSIPCGCTNNINNLSLLSKQAFLSNGEMVPYFNKNLIPFKSCHKRFGR